MILLNETFNVLFARWARNLAGYFVIVTIAVRSNNKNDR